VIFPYMHTLFIDHIHSSFFCFCCPIPTSPAIHSYNFRLTFLFFFFSFHKHGRISNDSLSFSGLFQFTWYLLPLPFCYKWQNFFLYCWIVFHCVHIVDFLYLFICWWEPSVNSYLNDCEDFLNNTGMRASLHFLQR
jgi:hypothetical protein